jgi:hypothetical protein
MFQSSTNVEVIDVSLLVLPRASLRSYRTHGVGELYAYLPPLDCNTRQLLAVPPLSIQNPDFGYSVGRGSFTFKTEEHGWNTIAQRVRLNDVGCENGKCLQRQRRVC